MWLTVIAGANRLACAVQANTLANTGKIKKQIAWGEKSRASWLLANGCICNDSFAIFLEAFNYDSSDDNDFHLFLIVLQDFTDFMNGVIILQKCFFLEDNLSRGCL